MTKVKYTDMFKYSPFKASQDSEGTWTFDAQKQELRRHKKAGQDTEGDIKVTYSVYKNFFKAKDKHDLSVTAIGRQVTVGEYKMEL